MRTARVSSPQFSRRRREIKRANNSPGRPAVSRVLFPGIGGPRRRDEGHLSGPAIADGLFPMTRERGLPAVERPDAIAFGHLCWPEPALRLRTRSRRAGTFAVLTTAAWPCTRWGLPCQRRHRRCGALLPHPFTLTLLGQACRPGFGGRFAFCGTFPIPLRPQGTSQDGGRYPPPRFSGARTFLPPCLGHGERPSTGRPS